MHADEVAIDVGLVRRLVDTQFPQWADLPLEAVHYRGTDNVLYRLGAEKVVRLPTRLRTERTLAKEHEWLPRLAPFLPLAVPAPLARGEPDAGYAFGWSIYEWLPGCPGSAVAIADLHDAARSMAEFIGALQRIDPTGGPPPGEHNFGRGEPLANRDERVRESVRALAGVVDSTAVLALWEESLAAPSWERAPVWIHGDLDARNVLVVDGRITAVIDFGGLGVGDPATDVMVAWKLFTPESRETFRQAVAVDDATWARARGWALWQALGAMSYYTLETNPVLVHEAQRWLAETLADRTA